MKARFHLVRTTEFQATLIIPSEFYNENLWFHPMDFHYRRATEFQACLFL